jgi:glycosylphosphatidylinositol transamidase (GPIT) subunit GPI8
MDICTKIRAYLGLVDLPSLAMFKAMEQKQAERHVQLMDALGRIEKRLINEHVGVQTREFSPVTLDWDTVQAMALRELEKNPIKES